MPSPAAATRTLCFSQQIPAVSQQPNSHLAALLTPKSKPGALQSHPLFSKTLPHVPAQTQEKVLFLEIMGVDAGKALALNPDLHSQTLTLTHIESIINFLKSQTLDETDLPRLFSMCPRILSADPTTDLQPVFDFLRRDLRVPYQDIRKTINNCPRLLTCSVEDQLKPASFYLRRLGMREVYPFLVVLDVEKTLVPRVRFLEGIGLSREGLVMMVGRCPSLLAYTVEVSLGPKWEYFRDVMEGDLEEIKAFPWFFGYSLEKVIKPRYLEMVRCGVRLPLELMLKTGDAKFKEALKKKQSGEL